ncbi:MAG: hypothetical protein CM1200mP41_35450 [Gammaproteobacteria bacterium]|nr:MAG: hypothetical protein CM1200mP41_35450 [Gammaproteobacteria bacterium]
MLHLIEKHRFGKCVKPYGGREFEIDEGRPRY